MHVFLPSFKQHLKLFFKNKPLCILYGIMWLAVIVGMGFLLIVPSWIFYTFSTITRFVFYESLIFSLISYIFLAKDKKNNMDETISAITHNKQFYLIYSLFVLIFLLILFNLFILLFLLINTIKTGEYAMLLTILKKEYLLNLLLPQLASFSMGVIISQIKNRTLSSVILTATILLMSPYMDMMEWQAQPSIPIDQFVNIIHLPFAFFTQHSNWSVDYLYGLQNELYKVFAIAFWIILSVIVVNRYRILKYKKSGIIVILINALLFMGIYLPQSSLRLDMKWNGTLEDQTYYKLAAGETIYNNEKVNYHIKEYDMNVHLKRQLYVDGKFHLVSNQKQKDFVLTLYHQFDVSDLSCEQGLSYKREGDFLYLYFENEIDDAVLSFKYSGYHDILYSNNQAAHLPGYFPWYPMAGQKEVYFQNENITLASYGLNTYNKVEKAMFQVNIDANYPIVCNLDNNDNQYTGISDSLTIIGGNIEQYEQNKYNVLNYFPYDISPYFDLDNKLGYIEKDFDSIIDGFKRLYGIELKAFQNKKIIIAPKSVAQTQVMGGYAEFEDYVIIAENRSPDAEFIRYHLFDRFDVDPILMDTVVSSCKLYIETQEEYMEGLLEELDNKILDLTNYSGDNPDQTKQMIDKYKEVKDYFTDEIEKSGIDGTMKKIGQFILGGTL